MNPYTHTWNCNNIEEPLRHRKRRIIRVTQDLFALAVPFESVDRVLAVVALCPQHDFQVLTKRPERAAEYMRQATSTDNLQEAMDKLTITVEGEPFAYNQITDGGIWPLPNLHLGTSIEDQQTADERIPHLLRCPAAVRFLSCEPVLGPVDLRNIDLGGHYGDALAGFNPATKPPTHNSNSIHWLILGGESGPGARHCDMTWIRSLVQQCQSAGVPVFVKQLGAKPYQSPRHDGGTGYFLPTTGKGGIMTQWPSDLQVRQLPIAP